MISAGFRHGLRVWAVLASILIAQSAAALPSRDRCIPLFGFYPAWQVQQYPPEQIPLSQFTGIAVGFALPRPDGHLDADQAEPVLATLAPLIQRHGAKLYLSIGGGQGYGDAFIQIARDEAKVQVFIQDIKRLVDLYQLDGVDIDWEYWTLQNVHQRPAVDPKERQMLVDLVAAVRKEISSSVAVSVDIMAGEWVGRQYDPALSQHATHINLMAYDATGDWQGSAIGHHASVGDVRAAVAWTVQHGHQLDRMWLGMPTYGMHFPAGQRRGAKQVPYRDIIAGKPSQRDLKTGKVGDTYFETPQYIEEKIALVRQVGIGGVFFWDLTQDALEQDHSLIATAARAIGDDLCKDKK